MNKSYNAIILKLRELLPQSRYIFKLSDGYWHGNDWLSSVHDNELNFLIQPLEEIEPRNGIVIDLEKGTVSDLSNSRKMSGIYKYAMDL